MTLPSPSLSRNPPDTFTESRSLQVILSSRHQIRSNVITQRRKQGQSMTSNSSNDGSSVYLEQERATLLLDSVCLARRWNLT
ncbi:hypothetical protein XELAEV_18039594mg [Xenopus laevis]|uniref:Uncharacterized protein n=1 Tax=Xenopus laevis TaxID=8355 RepID=A0A974C970_XENLA|nr:hypothetical protein XELAEV_18039594mg [Xenopus laevis]